MRFSLVTATKGRSDELDTLLKSLKKQTCQNFQIIIIDQNEDDCLAPVIKKFQDHLNLIYESSGIGLSKGRNVGLKRITGEIIAFPDDDAAYPPQLLEKVDRYFRSNPDVDGLSGKTTDSHGKPSLSNFSHQKEIFTRKNIWNNHNSNSLFFRKKVVESVGYFDEKLGVPLFFGSSEETDYLVRALKNGFRIVYSPDFTVIHPQPDIGKPKKNARRARSYGRGVARLILKHHNFFNLKDFFKVLLGPLLKTIFSSPSKRAFYWNTFVGRWSGFIRHSLTKHL